MNQAVGTEPLEKTEKKTGSVMVSLGGDGQVRFEFKDVKGVSGNAALMTINGRQGKIDFAETERWIKNFAARNADVKTVLILPNPHSKYDDLIQLMAQFRGNAMEQIGIAPL